MRIRGGNDEGTTVHALVCEGLNLVFAKHRRPEILGRLKDYVGFSGTGAADSDREDGLYGDI